LRWICTSKVHRHSKNQKQTEQKKGRKPKPAPQSLKL
jgi:hypothetical protein